MIDKFITALVIIILVVTACSAGAQETTTTIAPATTTTTAAATQATTTPADNSALTSTLGPNSAEVRSQLYEVLHRFPPEVAKVLKLDPTLWHNQSYMSNYPALAAFIAQHPEIPHNPRYYLAEIWLPNDPVPQTAAAQLWGDFFEGIAVAGVFIGVTLVVMWLIKTILNQRRWSRLARVQTEVHTKLLDRFSSNEELMAYINTTAGKRFLEAAPIPVQEQAPAASTALTAPLNRVLWSVQAGVILGALGLGMAWVSRIAEKDVAPALAGLGILALAVGVGFVVSAFVSIVLSRRLGIWSPPPPMTDTAAE
jgi:hypothetical protein